VLPPISFTPQQDLASFMAETIESTLRTVEKEVDFQVLVNYYAAKGVVKLHKNLPTI